MKITPELLADDFPKTLGFYQKYLDFSVVTAFPENNPFFALLQNDQAQIMLYARKQFVEEIADFATQRTGGTCALYIDVDKIDDAYQKMKKVSAIIQPLHKTSYDTVEFSCSDPNGYTLMFAEHPKKS